MRLNRKQRRKKEKEPKQKQPKSRTRQLRLPKIIVIGGWSLLVFSVGFGVYNNITAVSTHTVHEKEVVKEQLIDTTGLQNYAMNFAKAYFTVSPTSKDQQEQREKVESYLAENLSYPTSLSKEVKEKVTVKQAEIWSITAVPEEKNVYTVVLRLTLETDGKTVTRAYASNIYAKNNQFSVVKLPILTSLPTKATVEVAQQMEETNVEAITREAVEGFLETFFGVYPKADERELIYYGENLQPIEGNFTFLELSNAQVAETTDTVAVSCIVTYKDNDTQLIVDMPYQLTLDKRADNKFAIKELR